MHCFASSRAKKRLVHGKQVICLQVYKTFTLLTVNTVDITVTWLCNVMHIDRYDR